MRREDTVSTRREFLSSIPAIWLPVTQQPTSDDDRIDRMVAELASVLERHHGGKWAATRDVKNQFVMICRQ